jgi:hypothetical protein
VRPVTQRRTGYGRGQCTEASLASLLEVALEAVPDLWAVPDVPLDAPPERHQPDEKLHALWRWLREEHQVVWCELRYPVALPLELVPETFLGAVRAVFGVDQLEDSPWTEHHIMFGPAFAGVGHCVVGRHGQIVWDPNPNKVGIRACEGMIFLAPLELCPPDLPLAPRWDLRMEGP